MEEEKGKNDNPLDHVICQNLDDADPLHQDQYLFNLKVGSCNTGENLIKDTCGFTDEPESEPDTEHSAQGGMGTPVAGEQCPSKMSPFFKSGPSLVFSSPSPRSQTSSSNNETLKSSTGIKVRTRRKRKSSQHLLGRKKKMHCSESMKSAHNDAVPLQQDRSLMALEFASCNTGENITKDACGLPVEPESELGTEHSAQGGMGTPVDVEQYSSKLSPFFKRSSWEFYPRLLLSQTSFSNDETLKSSTGKELREKGWFSRSQPWYLPHTGQSLIDYSTPVISPRPESEPDTEHFAQGVLGTPVAVEQCPSKMSPFFRREPSLVFSSPSPRSQTSSSNNETLKSSTGKELPFRRSLARPWYLPHTGQSLFNYSTPVGTNQSASSQAINPSDADLSTASQSQACTDLETLTHRYRDDSRSSSLQLPGVITYPPYPYRDQSEEDDDISLINELDTEHSALGGTKTTVAVAQYSREDLKRGLKSGSQFYYRPSSRRQISFSNNKSFPAASNSSDPLYKNIFETFPAFIKTDRESDTDIPDRSLCSLSETGMMNNCSSAAASTPRDPTDNTTEVQGSSTGTELREKELSWYPIYGTWNLKRQHTGQSLFNYSTPVISNQSASSQVINPSDADLSTASQSQACTDLETLTHRYRDDSRSYSLQLPGEMTHLLYRTATDACASGSQSRAPPVAGPPCPQGRPTVIQNSTDCIAGSGAQEAFHLLSVESESEPGGGGGVLLEMDAPVTASNYSATTTLQEHGLLPPPWSRSDSSCLSRSSSMPSLSGITSVENKTLRRAESSPDMLLRSSFEDFTPDIAEDENDETYRFQCSCAGLYRCSVTGLLFHMAGEGDVVYRTVPWDWRLLARHHKKPAGPLFDIKCEQQSVCGLHLPHCEIRSTGGCDFLSVAHVKDEGVEFIGPREITETHVVISITGFSAFGNVKDEDSPPVPVRAQVLLFYRPPADPDPQAFLNVLLLPRNVVLRDVLRTRKKLVGDESYIEVPPHCKLTPEQEYTLSTRPEDDQVLVQPTKAEYYCEDNGNYSSSFQVTWKLTLNNIKLLLRDANNSHGIWEGQVFLSAAGAGRSCGPSAPDIPSPKRLLVIRSRFVEGISGPVLKSLLDKLLEKKVMTDAEMEEANKSPNKMDKARFVIDTVRKKGEAASSEMIKFLCEADPFLCGHLGLI